MAKGKLPPAFMRKNKKGVPPNGKKAGTDDTAAGGSFPPFMAKGKGKKK